MDIEVGDLGSPVLRRNFDRSLQDRVERVARWRNALAHLKPLPVNAVCSLVGSRYSPVGRHSARARIVSTARALQATATPSSGTTSNPRSRALRRTRSSCVKRRSSGTRLRIARAVAIWIASRVLSGSRGKGRRALSTISPSIANTAQCSAAVERSARLASASASLSSPSATARWRTRSHSIKVKSEVRTNPAAESRSRASFPPSLSSSQARTALDSAYRFSDRPALHRADGVRCRGARAKGGRDTGPNGWERPVAPFPHGLGAPTPDTRKYERQWRAGEAPPRVLPDR